MTVAAYASLVSLTNVLDNLHYRAPFHLPHMDKEQIKTLQKNVHFLLEFVECHSERTSSKIKVLWRKVSKVASEAEDMIDFYVVKQFDIISSLRKESIEGYCVVYSPLNFEEKEADSNLSAFSQDIERVMSNMDCIKKELLSVINEEGEDVDQAGKLPASLVPPVGSSSTSSSGKNVVMGIDEHVFKIKEKLAGHEEDLQILPIVGMGGIGKTTLAVTVFNDKYIVEHFSIRAWFTVSQEYSAGESLEGVLYERGKESSVECGDKLYQKCFGNRFLVVMDDVWTTESWEYLKRFFPTNDNRSRVIATTRLLNVVGTEPYSLPFLEEANSWKLFCKTTFEQEGCPCPELEETGKTIVKNCRGLPLEILVIGRMLASNMTREHWGLVSRNISSFANLENDKDCLRILSLSYKSLPIHLKPCFLYMRVFHEDEFISISNLINFWVVEGFIKPIRDRILEEIAHQYAKDLIDRNLISSRSTEKFGENSKECGIHDLLRDLCLRESDKESFIQLPKVQRFWRHGSSEESVCSFCREMKREADWINIGEHTLIFPSNSAAIRRFVCDACRRNYSHITRTKLVRTITGYTHVGEWEDIVEVVEVPTASRFLRIQGFDQLTLGYPSWMHLLWNLQTLYLFVMKPVDLPSVVWDMPQLRCVKVPSGVSLCDPVATQVEGRHFIVLKNLHSLSTVRDFKFSTEVLNRIPNLKELHLRCSRETREKNESFYSLCNLKQLEKLEALQVDHPSRNIAFPDSLKKLSLSFCQMSWEDVAIIGSLTNLEALKLYHGVEGDEWNPNEGKFPRLKQLCITGTDLLHWEADSCHFPLLEELQLTNLESLEGIPSSIGEKITLHTIVIKCCSNSVVSSAEQIWKDQEQMGNEEIQIHVIDRDGNEYKIGAPK